MSLLDRSLFRTLSNIFDGDSCENDSNFAKSSTENVGSV